MTYQWKIPTYRVDAQAAGLELERIASERGLTPSAIVEESRNEGAVLHDCFEWRDDVAAEKYREAQAGDIVRNIVTVTSDGNTSSENIRAFVSVAGDYKPLELVLSVPEHADEMLYRALRELRSFQRKYASLKQLSGVMSEISMLQDSVISA